MKIMIDIIRSVSFHFTFAFIIRVLFIFYGIYHDNYVEQQEEKSKLNLTINGTDLIVLPKYTDIDYQVFTDGASYMYQGRSPYLRDTYRYTPFLAFIMQPNIFITNSFGKFVFILFDMLCGFLIIRINQMEIKDKKNNKEKFESQQITNIIIPICSWFYNLVTITIGSRGNAESIMSFLVLCFILFLKKESYLLSGMFYGLSIHFKIYPITYGLAILFYLVNNKRTIYSYSLMDLFKSIVLNKNVYKFGISFVITFLLVTYYYYIKYGYEFLHETYFYHLSRQDIRHNFSPYFYMLYITDISWKDSIIFKMFCFMPQILLIVSFSYLLQHHIEFCLFSITFVFVSFNKVCTSQYFIWYWSLIPIVLPKLRISIFKGLVYYFLWFFGQAIWLYFAYELEFNGQNTFIYLWISSILFLIINCLIFKNVFLKNYSFSSKKIKNN